MLVLVSSSLIHLGLVEELFLELCVFLSGLLFLLSLLFLLLALLSLLTGLAPFLDSTQAGYLIYCLTA